MAPRVLIIGYGNPLRGDDRLGWVVAAQLGEQLGEQHGTVRTLHQLVPELAEELARYDVAMFVDASATQEPGSVRIRELSVPASAEHFGLPQGEKGEQHPDSCRPTSSPPLNDGHPPAGAFTHHVGPRELLTMARALYGRAPRAFLVTLGGADFGFTETLSPAAHQAATQAVKLVGALWPLLRAGRIPEVSLTNSTLVAQGKTGL